MTRQFAGIFAGALSAAWLCMVGCSAPQKAPEDAKSQPKAVQAAKAPAQAQRKIAAAKPEDLAAAIKNIAAIICRRSQSKKAYDLTHEKIRKTVEGKDFPRDEFAHFCSSRDFTDLMALNRESRELNETIPEEWNHIMLFELVFDLEELLADDCHTSPSRSRNLTGVPETYTFAQTPDKAVAARNIVTFLCRSGDCGHSFLVPRNGKASYDRMVENVRNSKRLTTRIGKRIVAAFSSRKYFDYLERRAELDARRQSLKMAVGEPSKAFHQAMRQLMDVAWMPAQDHAATLE